MSNELNSDSENVIEEKREKIREILPGAVKEGKIDVEKLKEIIGKEGLELGDDKYDFSWAGQKKAYKEIKNTTRKTLKPHRDRSVNFDETENIFIEGENLDTLKTLQRAYSGEVKMIYIDPPYNTGKDFVYNDDFSQSKEEYEKKTGQRDEEGKLVANPESNGRFHSDWLNMMYPRLFMARNMLEQEGVIFVSIDDNEFHHLRMLMDEVFGEENFVTTIIWEKVHTRKNSAKYFSESHDYVVCYAKSKDDWDRNLLPREDTSDYTNPDNDPRGPWKTDPVYANNPYEADYTIEKPNGVELERPEGKYWRFSKEKFEKFKEEDRVIWGDDDSYPTVKRYLKDVQDGLVPTTLFERDFAGDNSEANNELQELLEAPKVVDYPKPTKLIQRLMQIGTNPDDEDIVMDFFAGSGTTGHAVYKQNKDDGGNRKFVCVQLPEETPEDSSARNHGYETVSEVAEDRIRKASEKVFEGQQSLEDVDGANLDAGLKVLSLEHTNFVEWSSPEDVKELKEQMRLQENPWKPDSDKESVIFEILLKEGFTPNAEISEVEDLDSTYHAEEDEREVFICLEDEVDESVVEGLEIESETKFVCKDSALSDTSKQNLSDKVNLKAI